jgi:hypothetical protein
MPAAQHHGTDGGAAGFLPIRWRIPQRAGHQKQQPMYQRSQNPPSKMAVAR